MKEPHRALFLGLSSMGCGTRRDIEVMVAVARSKSVNVTPRCDMHHHVASIVSKATRDATVDGKRVGRVHLVADSTACSSAVAAIHSSFDVALERGGGAR